MSYYKLLQTDIIQASQLYLGGGVNAPLPTAGLNLYSDGAGGTFWSSVSGNVSGTIGNVTTQFVTSTMTSTIDGLGSIGYASTTYVTNSISSLSTLLGPAIAIGVAGTGPGGSVTNTNLQSTVIGLGNIYVSTTNPFVSVTYQQLWSTVAGLGQIYVSSAPYSLSSQMVSTVIGLGTAGYISTNSLTSTVTGLGTSGFVSSSQLTSSLAGIAGVYLSITTSLSLTVSTQLVNTNILNATNALVYSNLSLFNAPISMSFAGTPSAAPFTMVSPANAPLSLSMTAGGTNALTFGIDGVNNASILSQNPLNSVLNPLTLGGSVLTALTSSMTIAPINNYAGYNNNTQIIGSTISTGQILANLITGNWRGDGSQLYNLNAISSDTLRSYTNSTMASTVIGLNNYLGYLSVTKIGSVVNTSSIVASTLFTQGGITAGSISILNTPSSNIWIAVGASTNPLATIETSSDGLNWTNINSGGFSVQGNDVAWNNNLWVAVGQDSIVNNTIKYSYNSKDWISISANGFTGVGITVSWGNGIWIALGSDATQNNTIKYSSDGINWNNSLGPGFTVNGNGVEWNGGIWVAVGNSATGSILYSYNGITWFVATQTGFSQNQLCVRWNGKFWLSGGTQSSGNNTINLSKDGINWSSVNFPYSGNVNGIAWNGIIWIVQAGTSSYYSYDGLQWLSGNGPSFSVAALDIDWNGFFFTSVGQDAIQLNMIKQSYDGITWTNSLSNNFTGYVQNIGYSSNITPSYRQNNFVILSDNIPNFATSTNQIMFSPTAMTLNDTLYIDTNTNRLGVNCNAPSYDLDVYGSMKVSSNVYASSFIGDGSFLTNLNAISTSALASTIIGLGNLGYISSQMDYSSLMLSSLALYNASTLQGAFGSTVTNLFGRIANANTSTLFISTSFSTLTAFTLITSTLTASSVIASTILTSNLFVSSANIQYANVTSLSTTDLKAQRINVSSLRFFDGDGSVFFPDHQASNISSIAMYTSSILTNTLVTSNIRLGNNVNQTPISFYGLTGAFNNTVIAEQSTPYISTSARPSTFQTQELLFFRGSLSSPGDQFRFQTTGAFRVETGVSGRVFPNTAQLSTTTFLIDAFSNVTMNNSSFYLSAATGFVGINTINPTVTLDVVGTVRTQTGVFSTLNASTVTTTSITAPSLTAQRLLVSSLRFYDGDGTVFIADIQSSNVSTIALYASTLFVNMIQAYNFISTPSIITSSLTVNTISISSISSGSVRANTAAFSSLTVSTLTLANLTTQIFTTSSIRFYDGDGLINLPDIQNSNISSIAMYASSILTNTVVTSNIRLGNNVNQTPIFFYGLTGAFNNTVIAEQSTPYISTSARPSTFQTQELLFFRGSLSSPGDQFRFQTTGAFRVETGVSGRVFPNTAQLSTTTFLIDAFSNVTMNNSSFYLSAGNGFVGINTLNPTVALDVNGFIRGNGLFLSNLNMLLPLAISTSTAQLSSITVMNGFFSTITMSSLVSQVIQTNTVIASTISTQTLFANTLGVSSFVISSLTTANFTTQRMLVSSLRFYDGDGSVFFPDHQSSNISSIALYTSSMLANAVTVSNIRVGNNANQSPITFYGSGTYANTVITEQSTGISSQELLLFTGISTVSTVNVTNQVRIQTTGAFRVETGVTNRAFPNMAQLAVPSFLVDSNSNVSMNGSNFFLTAANTFIGINCNAPGVNLDINGTIRATNAIFTGLNFTNFNGVIINNSSLNTSSIIGNVALISTVIPSTLYVNTLSSLYQVDVQAVANFSTLAKINIQQSLTNIWVAAGNGTNSLAYSLDGITWTGITSGTGNFVTGGLGVAWNGVRFVAVGQGTNSIAYSSNGINWTPIANSVNTFTGYGITIAWNGSRFIAGGTGTNALAYSADGINWTGIPYSASTFTTQTNGIAWNGKIWVAVGSGTNAIIYSADGITWTGIAATSATFTNAGNGIAWNGKLWVAVGNGINSIAYSPNGINWTVIPNTYINTFTTQGLGVAWNGIRFVAVGLGTNTIIYSPDGINWLGLGSTIFTTQANSIAWNGIRWVATGSGTNSLAYSPDGISWTGIASSGTTNFGTAGVGIAWSSNVPQAYSQQTLDILPQNIPTFFRSTNQIFNSLSSMLINDTLAIDRTYNFIGVSCNVPQYTLDVAGSANISSFTKINIQASAVNRWVAAGGGTNSLAYSADGINWTGITGPFTNGNAVAWNGIRWVACGTGGVNAIAYSADGAIWTGIPVGINTFTTSGRGIAWNGIRWVAVGGGTNAIAYSSDGINWTGIPYSQNTFTAGGYGSAIAWNGLLWVATGLGTNSIIYSPDGINWTAIPNSINTFTTNASGIAWNGVRWVAVGNGTNAIAYSSDGINWTGIPYSVNTFTSTGYGSGIAWNGIRFVAVGNGTNCIAYSGDGITWTGIPASSSTFTSFGVGIAWNGIRWVAVGQGTNTISYSTDGVIWTGIAGPFGSFGTGIGYSSNIIPAYSQQNLDILPQNIPTFFRSTNQIFFAPSTILMNDTLIVDRAFKNVGINCNAPKVTLDVVGTIRAPTAIISTLNASTMFVSSGIISSLTVPNLTVQRGLFSALRFYDGDGVTFIADVQSSNVSSVAIYTSSLLTNNLQAYTYISTAAIYASSLQAFTVSTVILTASTLTANFLQTSTISAITTFTSTLITNFVSTGILTTNVANISSLTISTLYVPIMTVQRGLFSSLRFYDGDGVILIPDIQGSNISTGALYASSITAPFIAMGAARHGSNANQSPITFYGTSGAFNNTLIAEQSTSIFTQELLFFRGSSISDQFRFQTTGGFRVETGVTGRLFPNTGQIAVPSLLIDGFSNMAVNSNMLYVTGATGFVGINCNTPGTTLDVTGTIRSQTSIFSTLSASTINTVSLTAPNFTAQRALFSSVRFYDGDGTVFIADVQHSNVSTIALYASTAILNGITAYTFMSTALLTASTLVLNTLFTSTISSGAIRANAAVFSSLTASTVGFVNLTTQTILTSSIRFYDGDGTIFIPDLQSSNISTMAIYTSSIRGNILIANNVVSTPTLITSSIFTNSISTLQINGASTILTTFLQATTLSTVNMFASTIIANSVSTGILYANTANLSSFFISTAYIPALTAQTLLTSSLRFYDGDGTVFIADVQHSNVSTIALYASTAILNGITAYNFVSTSLLRGSTLTVNTLFTSTLSTQTFGANAALMSSATISSLTTATLTTQRLLVSSIRFYDGDGFISLPDIQTSNISTIALYASSFVVNSLTAYNFVSTQAIIASSVTLANLFVTNTISTVNMYTSSFYSQLNSTSILNVNAGTFSSINVSSLAVPILTTQRALFSSLRFYDGDGAVFTPDVQHSNVSTIGLWASSLTTYSVQASNSIFTPYLNATTISTVSLIAGTVTLTNISSVNLYISSAISANTLNVNIGSFSTLNVSTMIIPQFTAQRALISSLRFYDGDGVVNLPDFQNSNISSIAMYASSINVNSFTATNLNITTLSTLTFFTGTATINTLSSINIYVSSVISANTLNINVGNFSTLNVSTLAVPNIAAQRGLFSSLRFYDGDGVLNIPDIQSSNVSSIASYASSITGNTGRFANAIGINCNAPLFNLDVNGILNASSITRVNVTAPSNFLQRWVAGGQGTNAFAYSADGITWAGVPLSVNTFTTACYGVAWNGIRWVAAGQGTNAIAYSSDGINWTGIPTSANTFTTQGYAVAWNGRLWVVVGSGTNAIAYSPDGINWTGIALSASTFTSAGYGIAWNGVRWVAAGFGTNAIAYSADGINWTGIATSANTFTSFGQAIAWNGRLWVAVGNGTNSIAYSSDGITWIGIPNSSSTFTTQGNGIAWNGRLWVATGQGTNAIAYSIDGINWTGIPTSSATFTTSAWGISWNGIRWIAGGSGTNAIAYSPDGINWTAIATSATTFTTQGLGIAWSSNIVPSYTQPTLDILPSQNNGIPLFFRSTNQIFLAASSMTINATLSVDNFYNRVGINNGNPQFNLDVYGNSRISSLMIGDTPSFTSTNTTFQLSVFGINGPARVGGTTWTQISDQRLKEQIIDADLDRCYNDIKTIPLRRFTYTSSFFNTIPLPDRNVLGFIAQEVKQLQPKAITIADGFGISDLNWLNIDQMNMSLYGAVKRMMQTNDELTSSVMGLQTSLSYCMSTITGGNV